MSRDREIRREREHTLQDVRIQNAAYFGLLSRVARNLNLNHAPAVVLEELDGWCSREEEKRRTALTPKEA